MRKYLHWEKYTLHIVVVLRKAPLYMGGGGGVGNS
jgi:hypothetical protein